MFDNVVDLLGAVLPAVWDLDVKTLDSQAGAELVDLGVKLERLGEALRILGTQAVARGDLWRREGYRSAAAWMAAKTGIPVGPAIRTLEMADQLRLLPVVAEAFRAGRLSELAAREIVDAVAEVPEAQEELVEKAGKLSFQDLKEECARVKASVFTDENERHRRMHKGRYVRSWRDQEGAVRLSARLTPDEGARLLAAVDARRDEIILEAYRGRFYENPEAHRADALVDLALAAFAGTGDSGGDGKAGGSGGPRAMVHVMVDYEALMRGYPVLGEQCEVPGLGPIPVALARRMAEDCILKVLLTRGVEITAVAHAGRTIPALLRTALECRDPKCIVPHCQMRRHLQIDHREPWSATRDTSLENLARLCKWHHYQKSQLGYRYRGGPGTWEWIPPREPLGPPTVPP